MTVLKQQSPSEATWWHKVQHHNQVPLFSHTHTPSATNQQQHTQGSHKATKPQQSEAPTTMLLPSHTHTGSGPTRQPHQKAHGDGDGGKRGATPQARGQPWLITRGVLPCHNPLTSGPHTRTHARAPGTVEDGVVESMVLMRRLTHHTMSTMH